MSNFVVALIIIAILALAIAYIVQAKRKGVKCVGCASSHCSSNKEKQGCNCATNSIDDKMKH